jgi:hypothetical protein
MQSKANIILIYLIIKLQQGKGLYQDSFLYIKEI